MLDFKTTNMDNYNMFDDFVSIQHEGLGLFAVWPSSD